MQPPQKTNYSSSLLLSAQRRKPLKYFCLFDKLFKKKKLSLNPAFMLIFLKKRKHSINQQLSCFKQLLRFGAQAACRTHFVYTQRIQHLMSSSQNQPSLSFHFAFIDTERGSVKAELGWWEVHRLCQSYTVTGCCWDISSHP